MSVSSGAASATKKPGRKRRHILDIISPARVVPVVATEVAAAPIAAVQDRVHIDSSMVENRG